MPSSSNALNAYGDKRLVTATGHGSDIATQRADDLDQMALSFVRDLSLEGECPRAFDVGCGFGGQAIRLAETGAEVVALDIGDYEHFFQALPCTTRQRITYLRADVQAQPAVGMFHVICCQRMIHYLPYAAARSMLAWLRTLLLPNGALFVSASGLGSELGNGYAAAQAPLAERFAPLSADMAEKHGMYPSVCLYSEQDIKTLLVEAGFQPAVCFVSAFGNIKAMAVVSQ